MAADPFTIIAIPGCTVGPLGVRNVFDAIQVAVTVFGPNDMQAQIPQVDELIHNVTVASP